MLLPRVIKELQRIPQEIFEHKIDLINRDNPKWAWIMVLKLEEILTNYLTLMLSLLVTIAKKNGKLWIHVKYGKLNAQMKKDPFPLLFLDSVLDSVVGHKMYSFISWNYQVKMAEDEENTWFISKRGAYAYFNAMPLLYVMLFSLNDAPLHSKVVTR